MWHGDVGKYYSTGNPECYKLKVDETQMAQKKVKQPPCFYSVHACMCRCCYPRHQALPSFSMMHTEKWERAWYSISSDQRHLVPNMGRVGEGYTLHVGSIPYESYLAHVFVTCSVCALSSGFKTERDIISCPALKT